MSHSQTLSTVYEGLGMRLVLILSYAVTSGRLNVDNCRMGHDGVPDNNSVWGGDDKPMKILLSKNFDCMISHNTQVKLEVNCLL